MVPLSSEDFVRMLKGCYIIFLAIYIAACTRPVHRQILESVEVNKKARSVVEWESASENPKSLFEKFRKEGKDNSELGADICAGLRGLKGQELTLFESEINRAENSSLLKSCREQLKIELEKYWLEQKELLQSTMNLNFQFQPRVEKRDLSKGYRAATGDVQPKELILTFDDGPDAELTPKILSILKKVNAKVMFFPLGKQIQMNPQTLSMMALEGHPIGSHSNSHRCLANNPICTKANFGAALSSDEAIAEIRGGHQEVYNVLGYVEPFFRFPYGESDAALAKYLADRQVAQMYWSIDSTDWKAQSNPELLANVLAQIDQSQRGIVLFHDVQRRTLEVLPKFLRAIYDRGYTLVILQSLDENARYNSQLVTKAPVLP